MAGFVAERFSIVAEDREIMSMDLTSDSPQAKPEPFVMKEGVEYRLKVKFRVDQEIVESLKLHTEMFRKGLITDKMTYMVGSYAKNSTEKPSHEIISPPEDAPKGMIARGHYTATTALIDTDKKRQEWDWSFDLKRDWE